MPTCCEKLSLRPGAALRYIEGADVGFLFLAASAVLLVAGSELFAEHAGAAGRRFGVTALAIGLVLAGAEPEEMVTAVFASARHLPGVAAGDAIGANVTMLTVVLGLAAVARPFKLGNRVRSYAFAAAAAGVVAAIVLTGGHVGRIAGAVLVGAYAIAVAVVWRRERRPPAFGEAAEIEEQGDGESPASHDTRAAVLVVLGVGLMTAGGWLAVSGADRIVNSLGFAQSVVGLTFVALATTAELFALVWAAFRRGVEELAIAGVLGSALYNATATLGLAALVRPLVVTGIGWQAWLAAALPVALVVMAAMGQRVGRAGGGLLVATYGLFLGLTFR
jgi:cation:H+ antiporter